MSQVINEIASIEVSNEVLTQLDVGGIYKSFSEKYRQLDNLKNFRSEYEKKNALMRWWHNDKLRDAQLDSAEVQAEFSKTIGQLMMISIMQSKRLTEQQAQLNEQQGKLKSQADGIAEQASTLQKQHHSLAEQSAKLENLVREYFELKGLTEDGAQKLIEIACEVKATKDKMLLEFELRSKNVEAICMDVQSRMDTLVVHVDERICLTAEQSQVGIAGIQLEMRDAFTANEAAQKANQEATRQALSQGMEKLAQTLREAEALQQTKYSVIEVQLSEFFESNEKQLAAHQEKIVAIDDFAEKLSIRSSDFATALADAKTEMASCIEQQQVHQGTMVTFQQEVSKSLKRLHYVAVGMSVAVLGLVGAMTYFMKLI